MIYNGNNTRVYIYYTNIENCKLMFRPKNALYLVKEKLGANLLIITINLVTLIMQNVGCMKLAFILKKSRKIKLTLKKEQCKYLGTLKKLILLIMENA